MSVKEEAKPIRNNTRRNKQEHSETNRSTAKQTGTQRNKQEHSETNRNTAKQTGTQRNEKKHSNYKDYQVIICLYIFCFNLSCDASYAPSKSSPECKLNMIINRLILGNENSPRVLQEIPQVLILLK